MTPILQTKFDNDGNCLAACIVSLLGGDIEEVPFFDENDLKWVLKISGWMQKIHNKYCLVIRFDDLRGFKTLGNSLIITLINSPNPKVDRHAVITQNAEIVFDPMIGYCKDTLKKNMDPCFLVIGEVLI